MDLNKIKTVFFDLDNTLFDHTRSERETLKSLLESRPDIFADVDPETFFTTYDKINTMLWSKMGKGEISAAHLKILRFKMTFEELGLLPVNFADFSTKYLEIYSTQAFVIPNALVALDYLKPQFPLGLLSNGFSDVQENKLSRLKIDPYFKYKVYSEDVGVAKPHSKIFQYAAEQSGKKPEEIIYIGDSFENDIVGAKQAGWQVIFFNPHNNTGHEKIADLEITDLLELIKMF